MSNSKAGSIIYYLLCNVEKFRLRYSSDLEIIVGKSGTRYGKVWSGRKERQRAKMNKTSLVETIFKHKLHT